MLKNMLKATVFATTMALAAGAFYTPAFAEIVYNRGSAAEPESVDPHKTSTVYEANVLRDLFQGLVMQDEKAEPHSRRRRKLDGLGRRHRLHLQAAQGRPVVGRQPGDGGRFRLRLPPPRRSGDRRRIRLDALSGEECRGRQHRARASPRTWASRRSTPTRSRSR